MVHGCVYAVSGLPYRSHPEFSYTVMEGECPETFYRRSSEISQTTCKFECDIAPHWCYGYTYYSITSEEAFLGTTVSSCKLLNDNCIPIVLERRSFTYIREQKLTTKNRILWQQRKHRKMAVKLRLFPVFDLSKSSGVERRRRENRGTEGAEGTGVRSGVRLSLIHIWRCRRRG